MSFIVIVLLLLGNPASAQTREDGRPAGALVVQPDQVVEEVVTHRQDVLVLGRVTGSVLVLGGNLVVAGSVEGAAAAIGGSIAQRNGGFIGGDVVVIGGRFEQGTSVMRRAPDASTVVLTDYGEELREFFEHPWQGILVPRWTAFYIGQRVLGLLFYFLLSLLLIALVPAQLMRAMQALKTRSISVGLIGIVALLLLGLILVALVKGLPIELTVSVVFFLIVVVFGIHLFGSLVLHLFIGRWLLEKLGGPPSNINALLCAMVLFGGAVSVPVIGLLIWLGMAILSFGIALSAPFNHRNHPMES